MEQLRVFKIKWLVNTVEDFLVRVFFFNNIGLNMTEDKARTTFV